MRVAFRVDASTRIGTGHVVRCLTLAEALRARGVQCMFITRSLGGHLAGRIKALGFDCTLLPPPGEGTAPKGPPTHAVWAEVGWREDAEATRDLLGIAPPDWLVLDHYAFDARWEDVAVPSSTRLMVIDDLADRAHRADLILDQNLGREGVDYDGLVPDACTRLIGPRYALLRPAFAERRSATLAARAERAHRGLRHLLIAMGGVDLPDATSAVLAALLGTPLPREARITVVMGSGAPALNRVRAFAAQLPWQTEVRVDVADMADLMADADLAIGAVGGTAWERCCLGLPALIVVIAENQAPAARALTLAGAALGLGTVMNSEFPQRLLQGIVRMGEPGGLTEMVAEAESICDGDGTLRLLAHLLPQIQRFRAAQVADSRRVWEWRGQEAVTKFNRNVAPSSFVEHHRWFVSALDDSDRIFRILESGGLPVGYLRLDRDNARAAVISVCLAAEARGHGAGGLLLQEAEHIGREMGLTRILAEIHPENQVSMRAFEKARYRMTGKHDGFLTYARVLEDVA